MERIFSLGFGVTSVSLALALPATSRAQTLSDGDILVAQNTTFNPCPGTGVANQPGLFRVDPLTGVVSLLSGIDPAQPSVELGDGEPMHMLRDMAVAPDGTVYVVDRSQLPPAIGGTSCGNPADSLFPNHSPAVLSVDLSTGDRTLVSGRHSGVTRGTGTSFYQPQSIAVDPTTGVLAVGGSYGVFLVDPTTGDRDQILGLDDLYLVSDLAYGADGTLYVLSVAADWTNLRDKTVWEVVDDGSGTYTLDPVIGPDTGFLFKDSSHLTLDASDKLFVNAQVSDLVTGWQVFSYEIGGSTAPTLFTGPANSGPFLGPAQSLALEPTGRMLVSAAGGVLARVRHDGTRIPAAPGFSFGAGNPAGGFGGLFSIHVVGQEPPTVSEGDNDPPVVVVDDPVITQVGTEFEVSLDASDSYDPEGDPIAFSWSSSSGSFDDPTSSTPVATLGEGTHQLTVTVTDGWPTSNSLVVTVESAVDVTPPVFDDYPAVVTVACEDLDGTSTVLTTPTVTDDTDTDVTVVSDAPDDYLPGSTTVTWTATDDAGNSTTLTTEVVVAYDWDGLYSPLGDLVDYDGATSPPVPDKAFRAGRAAPLKLNLYCGDTELDDTDVSPPCLFAVERMGEELDVDTSDLDAGSSNDDGTCFRWSDDQWIYNLKTSDLSTGTWTVGIEADDGSQKAAGLVLR